MLKKSASFVLASFRPSTYPRGYASALHSLRPCWTAFLSILRKRSSNVPHVGTIEISCTNRVFPQPARLPPVRRDSADAGVGPRLDAPTADRHLWNVQASSNADDHWGGDFPLPTAQDAPTTFRSRTADHVPRRSRNWWLARSSSSGLSVQYDEYSPPDNSVNRNSPHGRYLPRQSRGLRYPSRREF
jgi:hypothetical protein